MRRLIFILLVSSTFLACELPVEGIGEDAADGLHDLLAPLDSIPAPDLFPHDSGKRRGHIVSTRECSIIAELDNYGVILYNHTEFITAYAEGSTFRMPYRAYYDWNYQQLETRNLRRLIRWGVAGVYHEYGEATAREMARSLLHYIQGGQPVSASCAVNSQSY